RSAPGIGEWSGGRSGRARPTGPRSVVVAATGRVAVSAAAGLATTGVRQRRPRCSAGRYRARCRRIAAAVATVVVDRGRGRVCGDISRGRSGRRRSIEKLLTVRLAEATGLFGDQRGANGFVLE